MPKISLNRWEIENFDISKPDDRNAQADSLIKRWKKSAQRDGRVQSYIDHEAFLPKNLRRKEKAKRAKIRRIQANKKHRHYDNSEIGR